MTSLSNIIAFVFDLVMLPFKNVHPMWSMTFISAMTGVLMVVIYKYTSNQAEIRKVKDRIKANFVAIMLYKDSIRVLCSSTGHIFLANLRYVRLNLVPLLFMIVPVGLLLVQMNCWYGYKPLEPGESILVQATLTNVTDLMRAELALVAPDVLEVETPPVRIPSKSEVNWRLGAREKGHYQIKVGIHGQEVTKSLIVSDRMQRLSLLRHASDFWDGLLYPGESAIPSSAAVRSVEVGYQPVQMSVFGWEVHWVIPYFILSIVFGLALKGFFKVQI
jgi:hypothetical protein